ncbi:MAG: glutamate--tRNA ligase, partial [Acidimicrobiia bacterium]|nr:glutamate--tRNA ligase [Acidimicrobiia bacterium]
LADVRSFVDWLFLSEPPIDEASWEKTMVNGPAAVEMIDGVLAGLDECPWTNDGAYELVGRVGEANGLKLGKAQAPIRVAVTGRTVGPPLFESIVLLPKDEVRRRLDAARVELS